MGDLRLLKSRLLHPGYDAFLPVELGRTLCPAIFFTALKCVTLRLKDWWHRATSVMLQANKGATHEKGHLRNVRRSDQSAEVD